MESPHLEVYNEIKQHLLEKWADKNNFVENDIHISAKFEENLNFDSLKMVEVVMHLEEKFKITLENKDTEAVATIEDMINAVLKKS